MLDVAKFRTSLDFFATCLVIAAAGFLLWTQVERRWFRTERAPVEDVDGRTIDAKAIRHSRGQGRVVLVEFTDYQCPFCGQHARNTAGAINKRLVSTGIVRHVVFNFPLDQIHPQAKKAAEAAECAARQGRYWEMHDRLFESQQELSNQRFFELANELKLDAMLFQECMAGATAGDVAADYAEGTRMGVNSTPTFFLGTVQGNGVVTLIKRINGAVTYDQFASVVDQVKAKVVRP